MMPSLMAGTRLAYHFEQAHSREALEAKSLLLARQGWKPASAPRQVEVNFPDGRLLLQFSQAYVRPMLLPICERIQATLPGQFTALCGPIKPGEHLVHFYDDSTVFLSSLEAFILQGLQAGEAVLVIARSEHRTALEFRLTAHGLDLEGLEADQQLLFLDAQTTLASFLRDGLPSEILFEEVLGRLIARLHARHRVVRAFGEMVHILWQDGNAAATHRLEELWHRYCQREGLVLYCAYPRSAFATEAEALQRICASHSQVLEA